MNYVYADRDRYKQRVADDMGLGSMAKSFTFNADGTKTVTEVDFLADIEPVDSPTSQQFFAGLAKRVAANYIARHGITRPPKDEEEALRWAQEAAAEYIASI